MRHCHVRFWSTGPLLLLAGCCAGSAPTSNFIAVDESPILRHEGDGGKVQAKLGDDELELPEDFPDDLPLLSGMRPQLIHHKGENFFVTFTHSGSPNETLPQRIEQLEMSLRTELTARGWKVERQPNGAASEVHFSTLPDTASDENMAVSVVSAEKSGRNLFVLIEASDTQSRITMAQSPN